MLERISRLAFALWLTLPLGAAAEEKLRYPETRRNHQVDNYHGVEVADPYRWLERLDAPETQRWMEAQESTLASFLDQDEVRRLDEQLERLGQTGANYSVPVLAGGRYFYTVRQPDSRHPVIAFREGLEGRDVTVLDPATFLGKEQNLRGFSVSPAGTWLGYRIAETGSRWGKLEILEVGSKKRLAVSIDGLINANLVWKKDESGFFYVDYGDAAGLKAGKEDPLPAVRFHRLDGELEAGESAGNGSADDGSRGDVTLYQQPDRPEDLYGIALSRDDRYLVLSVFEGTASKNRVLVADLEEETPRFAELIGDGRHAYTFLGSREEHFFFYTNQGAPNGRILAIDPRHPQRERWVEIVPEQEDVLAGGSNAGGNAMNLVGDRLLLLYRQAADARLRIFRLDGRLERERSLGTGWIGSGLVGTDSKPEIWYSFNGFVEPSTVYRLDLETGRTRRFFDRELPIDPADYVLENVHYPSKDGTRVPLFIAHKRGLKRDGGNPVFMYAYGFNGWVAVPWYQPQMLAWLEMGGVYVLPGVRGGGEYGDAWRDAGMRLNRQNAIDDYVAAAEWLVEERYTRPGRIVANGWSASGSLAAAAVLQRPELFGAGLVGIPYLDMLRYQHFTTIKGWTRGYGSSEDPEEFDVLFRWSPYHNIREDRCYPPILVTVGEKDTVTPPLHGYKFVAALQHKERCPRPALLKIARGAGHGYGATPEASRRTYAEELTFLRQALKMND